MKFGLLWWPNSWLKMLAQVPPHDGVAALAAVAVPSTPAVPTPPTMASVAPVARTLLLMDISGSSFLGTSQPCPAHGCRAGPPRQSLLARDSPIRTSMATCGNQCPVLPDSEDARRGRVVDGHHPIYTSRDQIEILEFSVPLDERPGFVLAERRTTVTPVPRAGDRRHLPTYDQTSD